MIQSILDCSFPIRGLSMNIYGKERRLYHRYMLVVIVAIQ